MPETVFHNAVYNLEAWQLFSQSAPPSPMPWLPSSSNMTAPLRAISEQEIKKRKKGRVSAG